MIARAGADRAHMAIESATGDDYAFRQSELRGPLRGDAPDRQIGGVALGEQRIGQCIDQAGVQLGQELAAWHATPVGVPQALVPGGTTPTANRVRAGGAAQ